MKREREMGGRQPQVKGHLEPPEMEEAGGTLPRAQDLWPPDFVKISSRCSKPPSLWSFVPAVPGHSHTDAKDMCRPSMNLSVQVTKGQDSLQDLPLIYTMIL